MSAQAKHFPLSDCHENKARTYKTCFLTKAICGNCSPQLVKMSTPMIAIAAEVIELAESKVANGVEVGGGKRDKASELKRISNGYKT